MENNKITDQDKAKIESIVNMSIANKCYEEMESNKDYALIPVYCHLFVGNAQKGEIALLQAYNTSRQYGRPTSISALLNMLFQGNGLYFHNEVESTVTRTVIGFDTSIKIKETSNSDTIEFNVLLLTKKVGNGVEVIKLQVYDKPLELKKNDADKGVIKIILPWCHNIFVEDETRTAVREEILKNAKIAAQELNAKIADEEKKKSEEEKNINNSESSEE